MSRERADLEMARWSGPLDFSRSVRFGLVDSVDPCQIRQNPDMGPACPWICLQAGSSDTENKDGHGRLARAADALGGTPNGLWRMADV